MSYKSNLLGLCLLATALILQVVCANVVTNEVTDDFYMLQGVRVYSNDRQCTLLGGICVKSSDCSLPTTNKGLCPTNAHLGVECCYELPRQ
ncbi:uncharacterized protein LOC108595430 isoform X2 [Drosophila busckii]|uniref:uncharacterized protein LOC108595430 isoform X2 n=1 Tax=Drosophila busckii TaxID=30019 RepID=UPI00083EA067|nr:uncharacterized protein LOC108595430 isoform X2 [Drosophila busckii]